MLPCNIVCQGSAACPQSHSIYREELQRELLREGGGGVDGAVAAGKPAGVLAVQTIHATGGAHGSYIEGCKRVVHYCAYWTDREVKQWRNKPTNV